MDTLLIILRFIAFRHGDLAQRKSYVNGKIIASLVQAILMPLKRKQVQLKVTTVGEPDICKLSESEQKAFYVSRLMRILDNRRQQLEEQSSVNAQKDNAVPRV